MVPHANTSQATARVVWNLLDQKRQGNPVSDSVGLVIQGGGMRGVYSMAALAALQEMGFHECFDHVAGSSAGALNGAYFITGQSHYGVETYIHYLTQKSFVNPFRFRKIVDIDWLVDYIGKEARRLHFDKLISAETLLHITLTAWSNGEPHYVTTRTPDIDIWEAFRASAAMPILYNKAIKVGDGHYVDGSLRAPVPIQRVVDHGCRYVVVILTMPNSHRLYPTSTFLRSLSWPATRHYSLGLRQALFSDHDDYNRMKIDLSQGNSPVNGHTDGLIVIAPRQQPERLSMITTDRQHLMQTALQAREDTWRAFGHTPPPIDEPFAMTA